MASINIHLAIAKKYAEKNHNIKNLEEFYIGAVAPDIADNTDISHFSNNMNCSKNNIIDFFHKKVMLNKYLEKNEIINDYDKGYFLHLVTDYLFFNYFFAKNYLINTTYQEFYINLYYSYDLIENYLKQKYNISYLSLPKEIKQKVINIIKRDKNEKNCKENKIGNNILPIDKIDKFINFVSDIDLEKYKDKIILIHENTLP